MQAQAAQIGLDLAEVGVGTRRGDAGLQPLGKAGDGLFAAGWADLDGSELVSIGLGEVGLGFVAKEIVKRGDGSVLEIGRSNFRA